MLAKALAICQNNIMPMILSHASPYLNTWLAAKIWVSGTCKFPFSIATNIGRVREKGKGKHVREKGKGKTEGGYHFF